MSAFTESAVEEAALAWLEAGGWQIAHGDGDRFLEVRDRNEEMLARIAVTPTPDDKEPSLAVVT